MTFQVKVAPSGGWGSFLWPGMAMDLKLIVSPRHMGDWKYTHFLSSISIVSMVFSRFQYVRQGNFDGSTWEDRQ